MTDRAKYWQRMLTAWESSGLTQAEFCRRRGVKAVTFAWWKRQLVGPIRGGGRSRRKRVGRQAGAGSSAPSFVEVALPDGAGRSLAGREGAGDGELGYEVVFPSGVSIRLPADFAMDKAAHLIQAVRSC